MKQPIGISQILRRVLRWTNNSTIIFEGRAFVAQSTQMESLDPQILVPGCFSCSRLAFFLFYCPCVKTNLNFTPLLLNNPCLEICPTADLLNQRHNKTRDE